jgi:hypothetical protein
MSLLDRLRGDGVRAQAPLSGRLARDARAMRTTLSALHAERSASAAPASWEPDLRAILRDLLEGEVVAPTDDVRFLISAGTDAGDFYDSEIEPSWDGLDENARAAKLDGFLELARMADASPEALPREMVATVRTKTIVLAWAFDEVHGYLAQLEI